jgi:hypothetical protein
MAAEVQAGQARPALKERPVRPCRIPPGGIYGERVAGDQVRSTGGGPDDERLRHERLGLLLMTLGMLSFWALVAVLALALLRRPGQPDQQPQSDQQPRCRGDPGRAAGPRRARPDEYRQRLQTLQETTSRP